MNKNAKKSLCKYGLKCYQRSKKHVDAFYHPHRENEQNEEADQPAKKKMKIEDVFKKEDSPKKEDSSNKRNDEDEEEKVEEEVKAQPSTSEQTTTAAGSSSGYVREQEKEESTNGTEEVPPSPEDVRENIKSKFLVEMPEDFYNFWDLAKEINKETPTKAFKSSLGLQLVGPYDILNGGQKGKSVTPSAYLRHWRYYYDPPEFQTVISGDDKSQFHMGYFRDDPKESPVFVASNAAKDNCIITPRGENMFSAVLWFLEDTMKKDKVKGGPLEKLKNKITEAAKKHGYPTDTKTKQMKARDKNVVCKSFHSAGIVVPVDENEVGYRPVPETPADLKRMFKSVTAATSDDERNKAMDPIMEIVMLIQFANDECDYGEGLELGMDMFSYGGEVFHKMILKLMPLAYQFLRRLEFGKIIEAHLKDRKHSANLSVLE